MSHTGARILIPTQAVQLIIAAQTASARYEGKFQPRSSERNGRAGTIQPNTVFSGRDGNIYRHNPSGSVDETPARHGIPAQRRPPRRFSNPPRQSMGSTIQHFRSYGGGFAHSPAAAQPLMREVGVGGDLVLTNGIYWKFKI